MKEDHLSKKTSQVSKTCGLSMLHLETISEEDSHSKKELLGLIATFYVL
jgi:hypothetical protein